VEHHPHPLFAQARRDDGPTERAERGGMTVLTVIIRTLTLLHRVLRLSPS
jgi:hypothetical protein